MKRFPSFALIGILSTGTALTADFDAAFATNAVGLELYRQLAPAKPGENLVLSPYSIESALALAYTGADGDTRTEMARVLRFPADNAPLQSGFASLRRALAEIAERSQQVAASRHRSGGSTAPIQWHAANRLFGQDGYALRESFLTLMKDGFEAPFTALDFRQNPDHARGVINHWVEEQTQTKIRELIPPNALGADTRLVLVNALYLKAPWEKAFEAHTTDKRAFRVGGDRLAYVPTMHRTASLGYAHENDLTIVTIDYLGDGLQFVIALPDEGAALDAVAAKLTPVHFARWATLADQSRREVALYLPRFKVEGATIRLGEALRALGVRQAFDVPKGSANFDRIAPRQADDYLAISDVFHQTFIAVDEQGTEAAAATAIGMITLGMMATPPKPIEVRVDRPFLFAIQHRASGACLFLGRIADPR